MKLIPRGYLIFQECISKGVELGYNRAHKHLENPTKEQLCESIEQEITTALDEYFEISCDTWKTETEGKE